MIKSCVAPELYSLSAFPTELAIISTSRAVPISGKVHKLHSQTHTLSLVRYRGELE